MKKFIFMMVAIMTMAMGANAQVYDSQKLTDNVSVGLSVGAYTPAQGHKFFGDIAPTVAITATKYFTPIFGLAVEAQSFVNAKGVYHSCALPYTTNIGATANVNVSNLIWGYKGAPRTWEVETRYGLGWGHIWGDADGRADAGLVRDGAFAHNFMTSKAGVNINWNFDKEKAWTLSLRPAMTWNLDGYRGDVNHNTHYDLGNAAVELSVGLTYHFKNSNKKRYFTTPEPVIIEKVKEVEKVVIKEVIKEVPAKRPEAVVRPNSWTVNFAKGSSDITSDITKIAESIKKSKANLVISGFTSPEGSEKLNKALGEARAEALKKALVAAGVDASRITVDNSYEAQRAATVTLSK